MAKDATVSRTPADLRASIEAKRGIVRDGEGRIVRSKAWLKERIATLESKVVDLAQRTKNAKAEIKQREAELKTAK